MPPPKPSKRSSKKKETGAAIGFPLVVYPEDVAAVNRYKGLFPSWSYPYISRIIDVKPDGNCGFRAIAEGLGMGQNCWREVRVAMKNEMDRNPDWWRERLNTEHPEFFETTRSRLEFLETVQDAPRNRWFQLPAHGYVVAQAFNCVLILMEPHSSQTFFPMREGPDLFRGHPGFLFVDILSPLQKGNCGWLKWADDPTCPSCEKVIQAMVNMMNKKDEFARMKTKEVIRLKMLLAISCKSNGNKECQLGEDELIASLVQADELFRPNEEHEIDPGDDYDPEVLKAAFDYTGEPEEDYYHDPYENDPVWDSDWSNDDCHWK
ncbi:uncharacterized protein LOC143598934 [Bidens hawaiensis]|uniref:uncharacterized protein LOC143598934 n=1 Tax=Bidens hawaiensis TaxID=980011 RepID=UPI00404A497B